MDEATPDILEAFEVIRHDPALNRWWKEQQAFHDGMKKSFTAIPVPPELRARLYRRSKIVSLPWWQRPQLWASAAAAIILAVGLFGFLHQRDGDAPFNTFRSRMVRTVLRQYRMDLLTNDIAAIRQFHKANSAPADYILPLGLEKLTPIGAGVLSWQGSRVSMVCMKGPTGDTLFLFVADGSKMKAPPATTAQYETVKKFSTISWSSGKEVYVLAAEVPSAVLEQQF